MLTLINGGEILTKCDKSTTGQIIVPDGVISIQSNAFQDCASITEITLPSTVSNIASGAFKNCINLEHINIPESVTKIAGECFSGCISLIDIKLPNKLKEISFNAFFNCANISSINIPNSVTEIGNQAFYGCENLLSIQIPEHLPYIYSKTFLGCSSLMEIIIPEYVQDIGDMAFGDCSNLRCLIIKSKHINIHPTAFFNCKELSRLYLADFKPNIAISAFGDCDKLNIISPLTDVQNVKSKQTVTTKEVHDNQAIELRYMSLFYRLYGMNLTQMKWSESFKNIKSFKEPINSSWEDLKHQEQPLSDLLSLNWQNSAGIGIVLGFNNFRALDFDIYDDFVFKLEYDGGTVDDFIKEILNILKLPDNYPWVIRSGNGYGFHIIFKCNNIQATKDFDSLSFEPNEQYGEFNTRYFARIELRWCDHLVLPPSIHASGNQYYFRNKVLPDVSPYALSLRDIDRLLYKYCGDRSFFTATYQGRILELTKVEKIRSRHDSYLSPHDINKDSIDYLQEVDSDEGQNLLALKYIFGEDVNANIDRAVEILLSNTDSQSSLYNLLNIYAVGLKDCSWDEYWNLYNKLDKGLFKEHMQTLDNNTNQYMQKPELYLFFDTETIGLPKDYNAPASNIDNWPRMVQLSWIVTDNCQKIVSQHNHIIKPDGFVIPEKSVAIHGITTQYALNHGENILEVLRHFHADVKKSKYIVGHNVLFDEKIVEAEFIRARVGTGALFNANGQINLCTMNGTTNLCRLTGGNNYGYRYPKLEELYLKLFGTTFEHKHDALSDILATIKCFWALKEKGWSNDDFIIKTSPSNNDDNDLPF